MARNHVFKNSKAKNTNNVTKNNVSPLKRRLGVKAKAGIPDARQKIIQKKRKTVVDARDVLARIATTQDARKKLQNIRGQQLNKGNNAAAVKQIGKNILRKTDKNGQICLVTNKQQRPMNNISTKIREQLQMQQVQRVKKLAALKRAKELGPKVMRKAIHNEYDMPRLHPAYYQPPADMYRLYAGMSPMLAPVEYRRPVVDMPISRSLISDTLTHPMKTFNTHARLGREVSGYVDLDAMDYEDMPVVIPNRPGMTRLPSNVHSRLDTAAPLESHGIFSHTKTKVVVPIGHRIVVSNLQPTVTQDDIRELFEDIGQLLVARLVRPGTAEVIYKNLQDAEKAVDTYHNRQLDGQPMKCLLVNKRPLNNPTAPAIKKSNDANLSNKLVPDLSTIHKVLFQRK